MQEQVRKKRASRYLLGYGHGAKLWCMCEAICGGQWTALGPVGNKKARSQLQAHAEEAGSTIMAEEEA